MGINERNTIYFCSNKAYLYFLIYLLLMVGNQIMGRGDKLTLPPVMLFSS